MKTLQHNMKIVDGNQCLKCLIWQWGCEIFESGLFNSISSYSSEFLFICNAMKPPGLTVRKNGFKSIRVLDFFIKKVKIFIPF